MPYTPPARSPAASSYVTPAQTPGNRPRLPHSNSSASYLQRHRRSPSLPLVTESAKKPEPNTGSVRQSPPPVTDRGMPAGAILSPPDSPQEFSDDDAPNGDGEDILELKHVVRSSNFPRRHTGSPPNGSLDGADHTPVKSNNSLQPPNNLVVATSPDGLSKPPKLSQAARKISHSRSATETSFFDMQVTQSAPSSVTQSDDSEEDNDGGIKPPLLRKKSGELVKPAIRPSTRRKHSSMPGTPTFSKAVHFNENMEQVRHFLQVDRPIAVSAGASPVDGMDDESEFPFGSQNSQKNGELELRLKNFPRESHERKTKPVFIERLYLSPDQKSLLGVIAVANLAFNKYVVARFTLDYWKTTSEVMAEFNNDKRAGPRSDGYDQFNFSIKLSDQANLESRTLLLCARYNVNGEEHWDNNEGMNFQVDFARRPVESVTSPLAAPANKPIPRSRHNSSASLPRSRSHASFEDDFSRGFDVEPIKFRNSGDTPPRRRQVPGGAQFSTRYDFGASLSAALSQAQATLGDRSGIKPKHSAKADAKAPPAPPTTLPARTGITAPAPSELATPRPDTLLANRQSLDSRAYQEFVNKYCFFGSNAPSSPLGRPSTSPSGNDGAQDEANSKEPARPSSMGFFQASFGTNGFESSPLRTPGEEDVSSMPQLGFHFPHSSPGGLATPDYHTPTAIHG